MDPDLPASDVELPGIDQVAMVVEDLKDGMDRYMSLLGVEPWTVYRFEPPELTDTVYRGEAVEFGMVIALADLGEVMVELIEPTIGPNAYRDHLDEHGEGLHHVAYFGWDREEALDVVSEFEDAGIPVLQSGNYGGTDFWYFDTREALNGVVFEVVARSDVGERDTVAVYPDDPYPPE